MPTWAKVVIGALVLLAIFRLLDAVTGDFVRGGGLGESAPFWLPPLLALIAWGKGQVRVAIGLLVGFAVWLLVLLATDAAVVDAVLAIALVVVGLVVAFRLAKPDSPWARRFYGPEKLQRARARYGLQPASSSSATTG